jgi:GPH family glycoside/pentoside/hexuronide:cation symporter
MSETAAVQSVDAPALPGAAATAPSGRVSLSTLLVYSAPTVGIGFMHLFTGMYLMKFSTDVLAITPAAMGFIFFLSRVWDAISDPMAGYLSDRTRSRLGRRRPWLLAGALPVGLVFFLMWSPPQGLSGDTLTLWMGAMVILFYTGLTVFLMPHDSLGAELSTDYHDRNRIFGFKRFTFGVGTLAVFAGVALLTESEQPRADARWISALAAAVTALLMLYTGLSIRERPEYQGRGSSKPLAAIADVLRNPHARLLLLVFFFQQLGMGALTISAAYHAEYVLGTPQALPIVLGTFFVASMLSLPAWVALGRHFDKKALLVWSMAVIAFTMISILAVSEGQLVLMIVLSAVGGVAGGCPDVIFPSLEADVIDYDEYRTGERKEGVYFAAWHFAAKSAVGVGAMVTGLVLSLSGFEANAEQTQTASLAIRGLMSVFPCLCYGLGALVFLRFGLTEHAHSEIRAALDDRAARASSNP